MRADDLDAVHAIDVASFSSPWRREGYEFEALVNERALCWVAEAGGAVAGSLVAWLVVDELQIATVSVAAAHRRRGIGRRLIQTALAEAAARGAVTATLEVRAGNAPALALYRSFGFRIVGRRPGYYRGNGEDALLMTLPKIEIGD
jgi:ribosomal-protein-alanine N-acetyltransferase